VAEVAALSEQLAVGLELTEEIGVDCPFGPWDGVMQLDWSGSRVRLRMTADEHFDVFHIFTQVPQDERCTRWGGIKPFIAAEPQTAITDAINLHERGEDWTGLRILEPGGTFQGEVRFEASIEDEAAVR